MVLTLERTSRLVHLSHSLLIRMGLLSILTATIGLSIPTFHRDKTDIWDVAKNWLAIGLIGSCGANLVWISQELEDLKPEKIAIQKAQAAQSKHAVASWLFQANKLHTDVAQATVMELSPIQQQQLEQAYQAGLQEGYHEALEVSGNGNSLVSGNSETALTVSNSVNSSASQLSPELIELVQTELLDGKAETSIIKDTLGMRGKNYKKGRQILDEIKRTLDED